MGYTTEFEGQFTVSPPLTMALYDALCALEETYDRPKMPADAPNGWCKWVPTRDGKGIKWSGAEKFYDYDKWLQFIIDKFLAPNGHSLAGEVKYQGEERDDRGVLRVEDGCVARVPDEGPSDATLAEHAQEMWKIVEAVAGGDNVDREARDLVRKVRG